MQVTIDVGAILAALGAIAGGITAVSIIWLKFLRPATRPARELLSWLETFREDWDGTADRPGVPGRPGMMVRMSALEREFQPNHGNSLRDRVNAIERRQLSHESAHSAATVAVTAALAVADGGNGGGAAPIEPERMAA